MFIDLALPFYLTHLLSHSFHFFLHLKLVENLLPTPHKESMDLSDESYLRTLPQEALETEEAYKCYEQWVRTTKKLRLDSGTGAGS